MKLLKNLWNAFIAWFDGDEVSDTEITPQQLAQLSESDSLEGWE